MVLKSRTPARIRILFATGHSCADCSPPYHTYCAKHRKPLGKDGRPGDAETVCAEWRKR